MTCCYLCKSSFECSLKKGGVFVPLQDHFEQFCLTDNFINCSHFIQSASASNGAVSAFNPMPTLSQAERRVFVRHKAEFSVVLSSYGKGGKTAVVPDPSAFAQTIDFAQGGMRVQAPKQLAQKGLVIFNFGEGFIAPFLHGIAEVCWQKTCLDDGLWEAGLSFKDQFVKAVIAVQMSS